MGGAVVTRANWSGKGSGLVVLVDRQRWIDLDEGFSGVLKMMSDLHVRSVGF